MTPLKPFWRRTPPALFPSLLGLFGLALAWTAAANTWAVPATIGVILGVIATILLLLTLTCYITKMLIRPKVLWEDLQIGPARGSVSAGSMCAMALAMFLLPYTSLGAFMVWWMAVLLHGIYLSCVILILIRCHNTLAEISPVMLLPLVGLLVSTPAAPGFGYDTYSVIVLCVTIPLCAILIGASLWNARSHGVPTAQRSSFAIFLAPPSVSAVGIYALSGTTYFLPVWACATILGLALLPFVRWMAQGGYSPAWGAFTFPISAFAGLQIYAVKSDYGIVAEILAVACLGLATLLVPYIVIRTYILWVQGKLATATNAAVA